MWFSIFVIEKQLTDIPGSHVIRNFKRCRLIGHYSGKCSVVNFKIALIVVISNHLIAVSQTGYSLMINLIEVTIFKRTEKIVVVHIGKNGLFLCEETG
ncbi:hypothetical protein D3C85_1289730 [compost metagenome]